MSKNNDSMIKQIASGTVLDHIPPSAIPHIINALKLHDIKTPWTMGNNFESRKTTGGYKGFIKITDHYFEQSELDLVALFASSTMVNIIENYDVVRKYPVKLPEHVEKLLKCMNPTCITNQDQGPFTTTLEVIKTGKETPHFLCRYCRELTTEIILR
ncbi:MAG: aspartate carbamoyltransferase regulatory subunit [Alphaproteobacteria bacterium]|nr:aspartate carbamoyltransferase regulatory subunit [Alphaproteobacteria bacterium]